MARKAAAEESTAVAVAEPEAAKPARKPSKAELAKFEKIIDTGLKSFVDVGNALKAIQVNDLYKAAGFERFEDYCAQRWGFTRARGYQLIEAAGTAELLSTQVDAPIPHEKIARELAPLVKADPAKAASVWQKVSADGAKVTSPSVREAVQAALGNTNGHRTAGTAAPRAPRGDGTDWTRIRDFAALQWLTLSPAAVAAQVPDADRIQVEGLITEMGEWLQAFGNAMTHRPKGSPEEEPTEADDFEREPVDAAE